MKTVGFIDYYLDEWHANNYPAWIKEQSNGEFEVKYAYAAIDSPNENGITNKEWAEKYSVTLLETIDQLITLSDCIVVLSPDDPDMHYELAHAALASGKPVYIDKTFALNSYDAKRMLKIGEDSNSPCFSSSALRFSDKLNLVDKNDIKSVISIGSGEPKNYLIHQLEPIAILMGTDVKKVMFIGNDHLSAWVLNFSNGTTAEVHIVKGWCDFTLYINKTNSSQTLAINDDFFKGCIDSIIHMFKTGVIPVTHKDTIGIITILETCLKAVNKPGRWLSV